MKISILILLLLLIACSQQAGTMQPQLKPLTGTPPSGTATTIDGQTIAYQIYPNKAGSPAVILLHMLRRTRTDWDSIAKWLQTQGYTVVALDSRGHGQSTGDWEKFNEDDFNKMTNDVMAIKSVLENQGADVKKLTIIGASIGANTAFNYAASDPDVRTVILLSPGLEYRGVKTIDTKFSKPFLVVASNDDSFSAQTAEKIAQNNPTAEILIYEDAGHGTNMFVKQDLAPKILEWLKEHVY